LLVLRIEQLKVGTNDLQLVVKKKVTVATMLMSTMKAFPRVGLALLLEVSMVTTASIPGRKVGE
jgi:pseudouridine-5'-phosphate glycosidase